MSQRGGSQPSMRQNVITQQCHVLHLPTIASQCVPLAEQAERERQPYLSYLEALLAAELEDRERRAIERRIKEAHLPRVKTLDEFDFRQAPTVSPTQLSELAEGGYLARAEPIVFIGDSGTGKTHLLTALCVAACRQRRRVRFTTAAALVNELVEAKQQLQLRRALGRWARYDVIAIDEVGYVPLAELGAEFLFQVIADRAERAAVLLTTNLPFSEWTQVIPNARLCKATIGCAICGAQFERVGRQRFCDAACRQAAWRRRHAVVAEPVMPTRAARLATVYVCTECDTRYLGEQRCPECQRFCKRVGPGGPCPHCDEPVAFADLST